MIEKDGLTVPNESKAAMTGDMLPFREPKSCEKPPIPMLSSLVWEEHGHGRSVGRRRGRLARQTIDPGIIRVRFNK